MPTRDEIKKRQAEERAALNAAHAEKLAEMERRGRLEAQLPEGLPAPDFVHFFGKQRGAPWVVYKVKDLAAALDILNTYAPVLVPYKSAKADGCRVLQPVEEMTANYRKAAQGEDEWAAPILRYDAGEGFQSAKLEFWTRTNRRGQLLRIGIEQEYSTGGGQFGFHASCHWDERAGKPKPGSWRAPAVPVADEVTSWASGSPYSASWSLRWRTLARFREVFGEIVAKRAAQAKENRERTRQEYQARRKPEEIAERCRFVLDTLNRPTVKALLLVPRERVHGWTLSKLREVGYTAIQKAAQRAAPEVFERGLHDFANTVYFLSKDTDGYDHAEDYRDDLRAVFETMTKAGRCEKCGAAVEGVRLCLDCSPAGTLFKRDA